MENISLFLCLVCTWRSHEQAAHAPEEVQPISIKVNDIIFARAQPHQTVLLDLIHIMCVQFPKRRRMNVVLLPASRNRHMWYQKYHRTRSFSPPHQRGGSVADPLSALQSGTPLDTADNNMEEGAGGPLGVLRPPKPSLFDFMPRQLQGKNKRRPKAKGSVPGLEDDQPPPASTLTTSDAPAAPAREAARVGMPVLSPEASAGTEEAAAAAALVGGIPLEADLTAEAEAVVAAASSAAAASQLTSSEAPAPTRRTQADAQTDQGHPQAVRAIPMSYKAAMRLHSKGVTHMAAALCQGFAQEGAAGDASSSLPTGTTRSSHQSQPDQAMGRERAPGQDLNPKERGDHSMEWQDSDSDGLTADWQATAADSGLHSLQAPAEGTPSEKDSLQRPDASRTAPAEAACMPLHPQAAADAVQSGSQRAEVTFGPLLAPAAAAPDGQARQRGLYPNPHPTAGTTPIRPVLQASAAAYTPKGAAAGLEPSVESHRERAQQRLDTLQKPADPWGTHLGGLLSEVGSRADAATHFSPLSAEPPAAAASTFQGRKTPAAPSCGPQDNGQMPVHLQPSSGPSGSQLIGSGLVATAASFQPGEPKPGSHGTDAYPARDSPVLPSAVSASGDPQHGFDMAGRLAGSLQQSGHRAGHASGIRNEASPFNPHSSARAWQPPQQLPQSVQHAWANRPSMADMPHQLPGSTPMLSDARRPGRFPPDLAGMHDSQQAHALSHRPPTNAASGPPCLAPSSLAPSAAVPPSVSYVLQRMGGRLQDGQTGPPSLYQLPSRQHSHAGGHRLQHPSPADQHAGPAGWRPSPTASQSSQHLSQPAVHDGPPPGWQQGHGIGPHALRPLQTAQYHGLLPERQQGHASQQRMQPGVTQFPTSPVPPQQPLRHSPAREPMNLPLRAEVQPLRPASAGHDEPPPVVHQAGSDSGLPCSFHSNSLPNHQPSRNASTPLQHLLGQSYPQAGYAEGAHRAAATHGHRQPSRGSPMLPTPLMPGPPSSSADGPAAGLPTGGNGSSQAVVSAVGWSHRQEQPQGPAAHDAPFPPPTLGIVRSHVAPSAGNVSQEQWQHQLGGSNAPAHPPHPISRLDLSAQAAALHALHSREPSPSSDHSSLNTHSQSYDSNPFQHAPRHDSPLHWTITEESSAPHQAMAGKASGLAHSQHWLPYTDHRAAHSPPSFPGQPWQGPVAARQPLDVQTSSNQPEEQRQSSASRSGYSNAGRSGAEQRPSGPLQSHPDSSFSMAAFFPPEALSPPEHAVRPRGIRIRPIPSQAAQFMQAASQVHTDPRGLSPERLN